MLYNNNLSVHNFRLFFSVSSWEPHILLYLLISTKDGTNSTINMSYVLDTFKTLFRRTRVKKQRKPLPSLVSRLSLSPDQYEPLRENVVYHPIEYEPLRENVDSTWS